MSKRRALRWTTLIRRLTQIVFLLLFLGLLLWTRPTPGSDPSPLVKSFFLFDPLILVVTWLAAHAVPAALLLSLATIAVTIVLGRVFCGWVCPLGTIHDLVGRLCDRLQVKRKAADHWSPRQLAKYYLLVGLLVAALFGCHWVTILDPLVLLYRTTTVALFPAAQWAVEEGSTAVYRSDPGIGPARLTAVTEPVYQTIRDKTFVVSKQAFVGGGLIVLVFLGLLALNAYRRRFWCRYVCPLGAMLGLFAWRPLVRRCVDAEGCNQCDLCGMRCHGAAAEVPVHGDCPDSRGGRRENGTVSLPPRWKASECLGCLNCTGTCTRGALRFTWVRPWRRGQGEARLDLSRRSVLAAAVGGVAALSLMRANPQSRGTRFHPDLIRPPGAKPEPDFLARCTACGLCMKICQTGGLQPATLADAGLEGIWTPKLAPSIGYCEYDCTLCGHVCPTGAIEPLSVDAKHETRIGLAAFDTTRCIPYAYGRDCMVCEEHCPIPTKAIYFLPVEIRDRDGQTRTIKEPHVDPDLCIGCGVCENVCPYRDRPGIRVSSANETRNPRNQPILPKEDSADGVYG